nr:hypothetical protein Q903MT_gene2357 [Picea sitchensis]
MIIAPTFPLSVRRTLEPVSWKPREQGVKKTTLFYLELSFSPFDSFAKSLLAGHSFHSLTHRGRFNSSQVEP